MMLYKSLVRPHLEYANCVWSPYKKGDVEAIEKVQKRATKLIISLKKFSYTDRLVYLGLRTLKYRRLRGDMIEVFKIIKNKNSSEDEIANVNFLRRYGTYVLQNTKKENLLRLTN